MPPWAGARVAIVHDWFQGYHGSERVVEALAFDVLGEAARVDVLTFHAARELLPTRLSDRIVRESRLARQKAIAKLYDSRSAAAHGGGDIAAEPLWKTYNLAREVVLKIIADGHAPTRQELESRMFGVEQ